MSGRGVARWLIWLLPGVALGLWACGLGGGSWHWPDWQDPMVQGLRVPRVLTALLVGAALAASGAALQALFRNPLADPGLIGTASGAALGVILLLFLGGVGGLSVPLAAFAGGLAATQLIVLLNGLVRGGETGLLLIGLVVGACCGALTSLLLFLSDDLTLRGAMAWLAGNLGEAGFASLGSASAIMLLGLALLLAVGRQLDALLLGEESAQALGIDVARTRLLTTLGAALAVGAAVSLSGVIGFIGMMVPNALGLLVGGARRQLIVYSAWVGGLFLLLIDSVARSVVYPVDLPAGLLAAFTGPPFFIWLLWQRHRREAHGQA